MFRIVKRRGLMMTCAGLAFGSAVCHAEVTADVSATASPGAELIVVTAKVHESLGTMQSASAGVVGGVELSQRPILRQGELLEAVPGMIVTAHTSGGKANQYYLRGFNLDHGTDFATDVEGVPTNLGTHAHGQGYMDLNWLIPELVAGITFRKGPYYADAGDFSAAGNASISYLARLPARFVQVEGGTDAYGRVLLAGSAPVGPGTLLYAGEYSHYDGPSTVRGDYNRPNLLLKYSYGDREVGGGLTFQAYGAHWIPSDQIPARAIPGLVGGRYGSLDPTSTGFTDRFSLSGQWRWGRGDVRNSLRLYAVKYDLNLFSNFTGFVDQDHGDQFRQYDNRVVFGGAGEMAISGRYLGRETEDRFGFQVRNDIVSTELDQTQARRTLRVLRGDQSVITSAAVYWSNAIIWSPGLRTQAGLRLEGYRFDLRAGVPANSGDTVVGRPAPKLGLTWTPAGGLDLYAQAGVSYRSNDTRGIFDVVASYPDGPVPTQRSRPLVRSEGAEFGARLTAIRGLTATLSFWGLRSTSELFFAGDSGANVDSDRPGERYGVELNTISNPWRWLTVDADFALSRARFTDHEPAVGDRIPEAIGSSASVALILHDLPAAPKLSASLRMRYFGPRDLIEDGGQRSAAVTVFNARLGYALTRRATLGVELLNLLNTKYYDAEYYDSSRLKGEPANPLSDDGSYRDHSVHAGEPLEARVSLTMTF